MAFEAFPSESVEALNDPGFFYVHENGKLRSSPGLTPSTRVTSLAGSDLGLPKFSPFTVGESYSVGHTCFNPRSLFDQTINFVARNLWRVESLVGFPDIVGKQLFDAAEEQGVFVNKHLRTTSLALFVQAYGHEVLSSLNIHGNHLMLAEYMDEVISFSCLNEIELGGCNLGEGHEIWPHVGGLPCLERLGLSKTGMSDQVMQRLTMPLRLMNRGPAGLRVLDLSGNPAITERIIRYLKVFCHLRALDLTGCCFSTHGIKQLHSEMRLGQLDVDEVNSKDLDPFRRPVENVGWASAVVRSWIEESKSKITRGRSLPQGCPRASKFYSSSSNQLGFLNVTPKAVQPSFVSQPKITRLVKVSEDKNPDASFSSGKCSSGAVVTSNRPCKGKGGLLFKEKSMGTAREFNVIGHLDGNLDDRSSAKNRKSDIGSAATSWTDDSQKGSTSVAVVTKEERLEDGNRAGLKIKLRRKRKRPRSDCEQGGDREVAIGDEERDLMNCYLNVPKEDERNSSTQSNRPKLLRAMDSTKW